MSNYPTNSIGELIVYMIMAFIIYMILGYVFIDLLHWFMLWLGTPR